MNFDYSEEQKQLREEARRLLARECPTQKVRALLEEDSKHWDEELWALVAQQGWLGAAIPEALGGLGLGYIELCAIAEELGRALAPIPFASTVYLFAELLLLAGDERQKAELLPKVARGEVIGTVASAERPGPVAAATTQTHVVEGKLSGVKLPVTDGDIARRCVVLALENGQPGLFLVDLTGPGVMRDALRTLDASRGAARVRFDNVPAHRLGAAGEGIALLERVFDRAAVLLAFEQLGGSDRCLEMARDYALERYAFGRVLGSYQAIKHKLADMFVKNQLARSNAYYGAWALNTNAPELPLAASAARVSACDAYWYATKENIQTHGGIGFTWEVDCHLFYRRAEQLALVTGSPRHWRERLVSQLERQSLAENQS